MTAPILILGWGNPSRGDDALGPLFVEHIASKQLPQVECLTDFQLQVEHALDLANRELVLFVDASIEADPPFTVSQLSPAHDASVSSHALSPNAVMQVYAELNDGPPPPCYQIAIRGEQFCLGSDLSLAARAHLAAAIVWCEDLSCFVTKASTFLKQKKLTC